MSKIVNVPTDEIDSNPSRLHKHYPYVPAKLDALERSMKQDDIGCWEGIIARKTGDRYQIAFGHHRVQAAKNVGLDSIPLIVRGLSDKEMVQFMGRENLDDYQASFQVLLETWEAAAAFVSDAGASKRVQPIDIAHVLGWTRPRSDGYTVMTDIAQACSNAHKLVSAKHLSRSDLKDLSVRDARDIVGRAVTNIDKIERQAPKLGHTQEQVRAATEHIAGAAKTVARNVRQGAVAQRDIGASVDSNAYIKARVDKRVAPMFEQFGVTLANGIGKMISADATAEKLEEIERSLGAVTLASDKDIIKRIIFELGALSDRAQSHAIALDAKPSKVTTIGLKAISGRSA